MEKYLVCSIEIDDYGNTTFFDCCGNEIKSKNTKSMNEHYREERRSVFRQDDVPVVWVLVGKRGNEERCLQVGQSKNLTRMLSNDIRKDVNEILFDEYPKEKNLPKYKALTEKYQKLEFYEVDINSVDVEETIWNYTFYEDDNLKKVYLTILASYVEAKIAVEEECAAEESEDGLWNPSPTGVDGYFYDYLKK